jgi:hypothetical protein
VFGDMTITDQLLRDTCNAAAKDLGVDVAAPYTLVDVAGNVHTFIAYFPEFGNEKGTLICRADEWTSLNRIASDHGYYCSGLHPDSYSRYYCSGLHPDSYSRYDRGLWIETFDEWGWQGPRENRPVWCKG